MASDAGPAGEVELCRVARRQRADELALVLLSQGIHSRVSAERRGFSLRVGDADAERARALLGEWAAERRGEASVRARPAPKPLDLQPGITASIVLLAVFLVSGPRAGGGSWFELGSADATRILAGEGFRTVTALTLHADLAHLLSNVVAGTLFVAAVCASLGAGVGLLLVLAAGAAGNLANAMLLGSGHVSVGASTAVFSAVGILGGVGVVRRRREGVAGGRAWLPFAAAFGLLAMLGMSERTDLSAHFFGFLAGCLVGPVAGWGLAAPAPRPFQWLAGALAAGSVVACWLAAFGAR